MNSRGISFLMLACAAFVVGFIPILNWITLAVALPLSLLALVMLAKTSSKPAAQSADKVAFWSAFTVVVAVVLRLLILL